MPYQHAPNASAAHARQPSPRRVHQTPAVKRTRLLSAGCTALLIASAGAAAGCGAQQIQTPSFTGLSPREAQSVARKSHLTVHIVGNYNPNLGAVAQTPWPNQPAKAGSTVTLYFGDDQFAHADMELPPR